MLELEAYQVRAAQSTFDEPSQQLPHGSQRTPWPTATEQDIPYSVVWRQYHQYNQKYMAK